MVRIEGLEPTRLAAPDPKSGMSTNFTISALNIRLPDSNLTELSVSEYKCTSFFNNQKLLFEKCKKYSKVNEVIVCKSLLRLL